MTCLLFFLLAGIKQNRNEKTVILSIQQSVMISMKDMNNVYIYDDTGHMPLTKNGEFSHTCYYYYDSFEANEIVGGLFFESNMTNFAPDGNDKCTRSNG
jgi:hypothetical protein